VEQQKSSGNRHEVEGSCEKYVDIFLGAEDSHALGKSAGETISVAAAIGSAGADACTLISEVTDSGVVRGSAFGKKGIRRHWKPFKQTQLLRSRP